MKERKILSCFDYLLEFEYFTEEELTLVIKGWGDNEKTYDTICQVRYGMDIDQLIEEENENNPFTHYVLDDYKSDLF